MLVTTITMFRAHDAEMFTHTVQGVISLEDRVVWRAAHFCDEFHLDEDGEPEEEQNNMFFRTFELGSGDGTCDLLNVDGPVVCKTKACHMDELFQGWDVDLNLVEFKRDGKNTWCATFRDTFVNLQESPVGFAGTKLEALVALMRDARVFANGERRGKEGP